MNGTLTEKIGRAAADFVRHPAYAPRYAKHNLFNDKTPLDHEIPWFSYAAIDFLEGFLRPTMTVCEYGTGGSTVFFARRVKSVFSIESDASWYARVNGELAAKCLRNATISLQPFDFKDTTGFEKSGYLNAIPNEKFDVIVVDGMEEWDQVRPKCFAKAENHIKDGGIIIVDDSWRYPQLHKNNRAKRHQVFQSVGPCRPGVTSTDVFFY